MIHSSDCLTDSLIGWTENEYRSPTIDASMISIATRGVPVGKGSDELASRRESRDVGKEPCQNYCVFVVKADEPGHIGNFLKMHVCSRDTSR